MSGILKKGDDFTLWCLGKQLLQNVGKFICNGSKTNAIARQ